MTPRKLYNFYIDPELAEGLKELKEKTGAPEAESVRRALAEYLRKQASSKRIASGRQHASGPEPTQCAGMNIRCAVPRP